MNRLARFVLRIPFVLLGVGAHIVLLLAANGTLPLRGIWHVLMLPAYVMHLPLVIIAAQLFEAQAPIWYWVATAPVRIAPFILADVLLSRAFDLDS
jgi:hypothetical protein